MMTPRDIIELVIQQVVLPDDGWDKVLDKVSTQLAVYWEIQLDTELTEQ